MYTLLESTVSRSLYMHSREGRIELAINANISLDGTAALFFVLLSSPSTTISPLVCQGVHLNAREK